MKYMDSDMRLLDEFKRDLDAFFRVKEFNARPCPICGEKKLDGMIISGWGGGCMTPCAPWKAAFKVYCKGCGAEKKIVGNCLADAIEKFSMMKKEVKR